MIVFEYMNVLNRCTSRTAVSYSNVDEDVDDCTL